LHLINLKNRIMQKHRESHNPQIKLSLRNSAPRKPVFVKSRDPVAQARKLAWWQVSCLQAVDDRFQTWPSQARQIGNAAFPPEAILRCPEGRLRGKQRPKP
jgi:hypothetical protein